MKRKIEKLIQATAHAVRAWAYAAGNAALPPTNGMRHSFVAHRLACAIAEMDELLAVHGTLWPKDQAWRERNDESMAGRIFSRTKLTRNGAEVAKEERPEPALAKSQDVGDLFDFFCQVRKSILYASGSTDGLEASVDFSGTIGTAMESIDGLDRLRRGALEAALSGYISNSFLYSNVRLQSGTALDERYWPLFQAIRLLRGETNMNIDKIHDILEKANIKPETRYRVESLINALRGLLSDFDIDQIRDILASEGKLFPGTGDDGWIIVIPGDGLGHCAPIVLAIAKGRDGRARYGLPKVMREVRAHLIQCFEIAEVVILLTDRWDPDILKESEPDFSAYASRQFGRKVLIPIVSWKRQHMVYDWP